VTAARAARFERREEKERVLRPGWLTTAAAMVLAAVPAEPTAHRIGLGPLYGQVVDRAVAGARQRLESEECRRIFSDFHDAEGTPLHDRLERMSLDPRAYLGRIVFADGFGHRLCRTGDALAITTPGSRVVYVCGPRLHRAQARRAADAEIVVLHEALHTLGLGENPPDTHTITRQVAARCGGS
jgi:hypothetical protein